MSARAPEIPRFRLFDAPSPLEPLPRFSAALGGRVEIWVKREDLLPLAFGGNKLRNLEFLVGAALADGADTLVTSGRRWSNHCRLTADRAARDAEVGRVAAAIEGRGGRPYLIGVGGTGAVGAWGQVLAAMELFDQADAAGLAVDVLVVPSATGGTQAGLIAGAAGRSPKTRIAGVIVARPGSELRPAIATLVSELLARTGGAVGEPAAIELDETQLGDGYGRPTAEAGEAADLLARTEGILVDPIYTAKALASLVAAVRGGAWDGQRVVFWHAGGLPGIFEPLD